MGYTHYFPQKREFTGEEWASLTEATRKVLAHPKAPTVVLEYDTTEPPEVTDEQIRFNGPNEDGCETFLLTRSLTPDFNFCKTRRNPYDDAVTAILVLAHHFAPGALDIGSDGDPDEWSDGLKLAQEATGLSLTLPEEVNS